MGKDSSKNFHGYKVGVGYMVGQRGYERSKQMSVTDIISEGYPWEIPFKLAEHIVDRYNLTVVEGRVDDIHPLCIPVGIIFLLLPSKGLRTYPIFELVFTDQDWTRVLYLDRTAIESRHIFYDLSAPFHLSAWMAGFIAAIVVAALLKAASDVRLEGALFAALAPFVNVIPSLRANRIQTVYSIWVGGCIFLVNLYLSTLTSNTVAPVDHISVKSLAELKKEGYRVVCTTLSAVKHIYVQQYEYMKWQESNTTASLIKNYETLLDMYIDDRVYAYHEQYEMLSKTKTAMFGELHNLNVFKGVLPEDELDKYVFADSTLFPKFKTATFQLHHAHVIARGLEHLLSNGICQFWENIRYLANRVAWLRALKETFKLKFREEENADSKGVGLDDTLVVAIYYCYLMGIFLASCALLAEMAEATCRGGGPGWTP